MSASVRQCPPVFASSRCSQVGLGSPAHQASVSQPAAFPLLYKTALLDYAAEKKFYTTHTCHSPFQLPSSSVSAQTSAPHPHQLLRRCSPFATLWSF